MAAFNDSIYFRMLAEYERQELIGSGTFGTVHLVRSNTSGKSYVMKEVKLLNMTPAEKQQALTEVSVLARCKHKNIIRYKEAMVDQEKGTLSIIMEYAEFGDMYAAIKNRNGIFFAEADVLSWFIQITLALQYIHNHNILHRDLKTQNIFLTGEKMVKIGDFGIARVLKEDHELATTAIGTPYYLSPEICRRKPYNCKSDIWALGCVLFEMSALIHPFQGQNFHQLVNAILKVRHRELPSHCSALIHDLVKFILHPDPEKRPSADRILATPALQPHLYRYLNFYSTPETLGIIDTLAVASLKKNNTRRVSADDILNVHLGTPCPKRTASISIVHKSEAKVLKSCVARVDTPLKPPRSLSSPYQHSKKIPSSPRPSPLVDIKNQHFQVKETTSVYPKPVEYSAGNGGSFKQTSSLFKKVVEKGERAMEIISNKMFGDDSCGNTCCEADDIIYFSRRALKKTVTLPSDVAMIHKNSWSTPPAGMPTGAFKNQTAFEIPKINMNGQATGSIAGEDGDATGEDNEKLQLHCSHSSHCQSCILDTLWRNRIGSCGDINDDERMKLKLMLQSVIGKTKFEDLYSDLSKQWNDESIHKDCSFNSILQQLNHEHRQFFPLMMQLLQLDIIKSTLCEIF